MKHLGILIISILALAAIAPTLTAPAYAHQRQLYNIGGNDYLIVIGSLNEPIFVDDRTGVLICAYFNADPNDPMNSRASGATPVEGLEETLQVEIVCRNERQESLSA
jgi:hypothetical protein